MPASTRGTTGRIAGRKPKGESGRSPGIGLAAEQGSTLLGVGDRRPWTPAEGKRKLAEKSYALTFKGYRREKYWKGLPEISGIYCVYACKFDPDKETVAIRQLLYIGESDNIRKRIPEEPKKRRDVWAKELLSGEELCVSRAEVRSADRSRVEAALIYHHKPPCNTEYVDNFPFDKTTVTTSGDNAKLSEKFTEERDN